MLDNIQPIKIMKRLFLVIIFAAAFAARSRAELHDVVEGSIIHSAVTCLTNEASAKDLQDAIGIATYNFRVRRSSLTNGLSVYVEIKIDGQPTKTVSECRVDYGILNNLGVGEYIPVFVAMNPVGSMDGEGILTAKKLHFVIREAGVRTGSAVAENPFYKSKDGVAAWAYAGKESATVFKLMECHAGINPSGPKTEITVRFHEW